MEHIELELCDCCGELIEWGTHDADYCEVCGGYCVEELDD